MTVYIKVNGAAELNKKLSYMSEEIKEKVKVGLQECGLLLKEEIESSIAGERAEPRSVKTGAFLNSIESIPWYNGVKILSDVEYAKFLEYGTSKMEERRHFRNSMGRTKPIFKDKLLEQIKDAIK